MFADAHHAAVDCPEIATPEGKAAKRAVENLLAASKVVTVATSKPDKYDRYLADVSASGIGRGADFGDATDDACLDHVGPIKKSHHA